MKKSSLRAQAVKRTHCVAFCQLVVERVEVLNARIPCSCSTGS